MVLISLDYNAKLTGIESRQAFYVRRSERLGRHVSIICPCSRNSRENGINAAAPTHQTHAYEKAPEPESSPCA